MGDQLHTHPQRIFQLELLSMKYGCDRFGCNIIVFPRPNSGARWMVVPCVRIILHPYTQQDRWQRDYMTMKSKLNVSHDLHCQQIWILLSNFGVFWRIVFGTLFFHQFYIVIWPLFCKRNGSKLNRFFIAKGTTKLIVSPYDV